MVEAEWKLEIKRVSNGYILSGRFGDSDVKTDLLIEELEEEDSELKAMKNLLWEITNYFGIYYSKHNKKNLIIQIENNKEKN